MKVLMSVFLIVSAGFASNLSIKTYQADFTQLIKNPSNKIIKYEGKIYIKQPTKMLWQYRTPIQKDVYMNKLRVIIDEPELEQAIFTKLTDEINLIDFLNNPDLVDDKYKLTFKEELLTQIQYSDEMENNIVIKFTNIKINEKIADQLFQFIAPLDYDIIKK